MRAKVAALLSVAGVLVAGSAAAIVNTQVLGSGSTSAASTPAVPSTTGAPATSTGPSLAPSTTATVPNASTAPAPTAATVPATAAPGTPPSSAAPPSPSARGTYQLGPGGSVTLAADGDVLRVVAVHPAPGWEVHDAENTSPSTVRVRVRNDEGGDVRLEASLVLGVISTSLDVDDDDD